MKTDNIDALTGIRGIAAWMVVVYHFRTLMPAADSSNVLRLFDHGYLAVDLFFILSGLVLYISYYGVDQSQAQRTLSATGIPDAQRAHKMSVADIDRVLSVNLRAPWLLSWGPTGSR